MLGIIGAMDIEVNTLIAILDEKTEKTTATLRFVVGKLASQEVVVCRCGVGKVNSAITCCIMLQLFPKITEIINLGVAGAISHDLKKGDIVVSNATCQHDYKNFFEDEGGEIGLIDRLGMRDFPCDSKMITDMSNVLTKCGFSYKVGKIVTGDHIVCQERERNFLEEHFGAVAVDMESSAIAMACHMLSIGFISLRAISDGADDNAFASWQEFVKFASDNSCKVVREYILSKEKTR